MRVDPVAPSPLTQPHCAAHPERVATGTCVRCGDFYCQECNGEGSWCRTCATRHVRLPWLDRKQLGFIRAYGKTLLLSASEPRRFCAALPSAGSVFDASLFGFSAAALGAAIPSVLMGMLMGFVAWFMPAVQSKSTGWVLLAVVPIYFILGMVVFTFAALIWPFVLRVSCRALSLPMTYGELYRVAMYASGTIMLVWVPIVGLAVLVGQVAFSIMAIAAHTRASLTRSAVAVLLPLFMFMTVFAASYAGFLWWYLSKVPR